jgi:hypothetical protein
MPDGKPYSAKLAIKNINSIILFNENFYSFA